MLVRVVALFALVLSSSVARAQEADPARGAEVLAPFKRDLQQALREGLARGPVDAIAACRIRAPQIAESISRDGIRVGRSSHRLRNPANAAPEWVRPVLEAYRADSSDRAPRVVPISAERTGYAEPISVQPLCLTCHGESIAPEVRAKISQLYPEDRAVGYRVGDLRGVFWVELPADGS